MSRLKDLFMEIEETDDFGSDDAIEVYADSVKQALELAARELGKDISMLDYDILAKGTAGILGMGRQPYKLLVRPISSGDEHDDLQELERKLSSHVPEIAINEARDIDSTFKIRVSRSGIWLTVIPLKGKGKTLDATQINNKLYSMRIMNADNGAIEKAVKKSNGKPIRIGESSSNPDLDSRMTVNVTEDEMRVYVHFVPPRFNGRHMEYDEIIDALRSAGVEWGIKEKEIQEYLDAMDYSSPLLAAEGQRARNGRDAYVDFKIRVDKSRTKFEEDESGKVDFRNLELLENVVVGQVLAVKVPAEEGVQGRTVTNRIIPAKSGRDYAIQYGKGTILSTDGMELTAEINGQVVYKRNKISVEPLYVVNGDVSLETGNIVFLGSVIVSGNVQDNFVVKAAGNVEVRGSVQKAFIEAEGDIIVHMGISGREEARIESTGGSIFAKFIQGANVISENDVVVPEGIMQSNVDAGGRIYCNGRRAKIIGGLIRAGNEVNARYIGGEGATKTEVRVGINPKVLQQTSELEKIKAKIENEMESLNKNLITLTNQKKVSKLSEDKEKMFEDLSSRKQKHDSRLNEINLELEELQAYITMLEHKGKICAEKTVYPGVDIFIKNEKFSVKDEYNYIKFTLEGEEIRLSEYEPPVFVEGQQRIATLVHRRRR